MATSSCGICHRVSDVHPLGDGMPWLIDHKPGCPWWYASEYRHALRAIKRDARGAKGKATRALEMRPGR